MTKFRKKLKEIMPEKLKYFLWPIIHIGRFATIRKNVRYSLSISEGKSRRIFRFRACEHGNVGDQAIMLAENKFFDNYSENCINISKIMWIYAKSMIKRNLNSNDLIVMHGGGYIGTLWPTAEKQTREIIKSFPNNKIVFLPNTIFFEDSPYGMKEVMKTKRIWEEHGNIHICAREKQSYDYCRSHLAHSVSLIPDIVLYLNKQNKETHRSGVLLCFRSDQETVLKKSEICNLINELKNRSLEYMITDTVQPYDIPFSMCEDEVNKKLDEFRASKLVVTDRLHGMIFAAITGTPCVAINNISRKVEGVYQWIDYLDYIKFVYNPEEMFHETNNLLSKDLNATWDNTPLMKRFEKLSKILELNEI